MSSIFKTTVSRSALFKAALMASAFIAAGCNQSIVSEPNANEATTSVDAPQNTAPTIQEARTFLSDAEDQIEELNEYAARVYWVNANFITDDTNWLASKVGAEGAKLTTKLANQAKRFSRN